jgi:hypothetical protein
MVCQRESKSRSNKGPKMANRNNVLDNFSSKYKRTKFREEGTVNGNKKRRPNWDNQRRMKQVQSTWDDKDED